MAAPLVSIVILAYKRLDRLRETLGHTFADLDYPAEALEVIVVDNGSRNGTPEMVAAEFPAARVIVLPENVGVSGWNAGLGAARGRWMLLLDDDGHLAGDTLARAVTAGEENGADLVSMRSRSGYDPHFFFDADYPTGLLSFWGTAALLSRRAVERTGGFDPNIFIWAGELELTMRILDGGMRHLHMPDLAAVHMKRPPREDWRFEPWMYAMNQRNLAYVAARSLRRRDLVPVEANRVLRVLLDSRTLDPKALTALPAIVRGTFAGLRARHPLRPEVSALYRRNFPDFGSPLMFMRGPLARLRAAGDPERAQRDRLARDAAVYAKRARYFPSEPATLSIPMLTLAAPPSQDGQAPPRVTLAILAHNRREPLRDTLRRMLEEGAYPADRLEPIVVDNASTDGTAEMVAGEFPDVRLVRRARNIGASAWNEALAAGTGEWFLILDDDCHLEPGDLARAVAAAQANRADLVSFRVRSGLEPGYRFEEEYATGLLSYWGCAALLSRRAVERLGGYDPNIFIWGNELELTMRLLDAGLRHLLLPDVVAVHMKGPRTPRAYQEFGYRMHHRHMAYVSARFLRWGDLLPVLGHRLTQVAVDVFALDPRVLTALPSVTAGLVAGLRARRPVRPEVSALYRATFPDFNSPLATLRGPRERLRARRDPERAERDRRARQQRFFARREAYFPAEAAVLEI